MTRRHAVQIVKPPVTWILVADARQAQIYRRQHLEKLIPLERRSKRSQFEEVVANEPVPVIGMKWEAESASQYDIGRNKTGMVFESASSFRSMSAPHMDIHEEIREHFARTLGKALNRAKEDKSFDRLVLIAPAKMLGELKKHMDAKVLKNIVAEMPKDLTHHDGRTLEKYLGGIA